ncbi:MAG: hypothetical protein CVV57_04750 [Tenericutes bacterium HGW-Tenericutes-2]|jgi:hypothetical protein|nr:MAG: hypothetical protein CVV57_04750 [Tenericutes bacterium HGW-Tenericutes-2]
MKKQNLFLMINAVVLLVISLIFLFAFQNVLPKDPEDKLFNQMVTLEDEEIINNVPSIGHYTIIHKVQTAYNAKGNKVGTVYTVMAKNGYKFNPSDEFGYIELLVGVDLDNKVYVQPVKIEQTSTYVGGIQDYIYEYFQGFTFDYLLLIPVVNVGDLEAGATASESTGLVKSLVAMAINEHNNRSASLSEVNLG